MQPRRATSVDSVWTPDREQDVQSAAAARARAMRRERAKFLTLLKQQHAATPKPLHPCAAVLVIILMIVAIERLSTWLFGVDELVVNTQIPP
jgi:hypothetical protein